MVCQLFGDRKLYNVLKYRLIDELLLCLNLLQHAFTIIYKPRLT